MASIIRLCSRSSSIKCFPSQGHFFFRSSLSTLIATTPVTNYQHRLFSTISSSSSPPSTVATPPPSSSSSSPSSSSSSSQVLRLPFPLDKYEFTLSPTTLSLAKGIIAGDRLSLSRGITLIESSNHEHRQQGNALLLYLLKNSKIREKEFELSQQKEAATPLELPQRRTIRLGISGPPGAGKSTFIEAFGCFLIEKGYKLAVLSIDPSSKRSGGSILGDKTRMIELSRQSNAYIRPSPSRGHLGGVAEATQETILLCEAAGYEIVIVETVGVGQSETTVSDMCDMMILLVNPGGGDELQGMKKGIMEVADAVVVTKADGELLSTARNTKSDYMHALHLMAYGEEQWRPRVTMVSSVEKTETGQWKTIDNVWKIIEEFDDFHRINQRLKIKRANQRTASLWSSINDLFAARLNEAANGHLNGMKQSIEQQLFDNYLSPRLAANIVLDEFLHEPYPPKGATNTQNSSIVKPKYRFTGNHQQMDK